MRKEPPRSVYCLKLHSKNGHHVNSGSNDCQEYVLNQYTSLSFKLTSTEDIYSLPARRAAPFLARGVLRCVKDYGLSFYDSVHARLVLEIFIKF